MTVNDLLNDLRKDAKLVLLMKSGLISTNTLAAHDIYLTYDILRKQNIKSADAVSMCAYKFKRSERNIYACVKKCLEVIE